eukprot:c21233_g1_i1 orf=637-2628(-)
MEPPANEFPFIGRSPPLSQIRSFSEQQEFAILPIGSNGISDGDNNDNDDDLELTFGLDAQQRAIAMSLAKSRQALRSEEYRQLFHLPPEEILIQEFNCALQKRILLQGHLYLFEHYVCFYSNILGYEKKKVIILKDVASVRKAKSAGLFPNAIEIVAWGKKSFFASFLSRDEAYNLIVERWSRHSMTAIADSDSQSNLSLLTRHRLQQAQVQNDACFSESSCGSRDAVEVTAKISGEIEHDAEDGGEVGNIEIVDALQCDQDMQVTEGFSVRESVLWEVEDEDAPKVPEHFKTVLECEVPIDVKQFFQLFFSNDSIKFYESFHKKCGDEDFQCTNWAKDQHFGHVRDVLFRHPIKVYLGSKASNCQEVQRYRIYRNSHLLVETSQQMNDIPYGDYFRVEGRWDVVPLTGRGTPHCVVRVFVDVSFSKKTVWKGKIELGTYDECKEVYAAWLSEAFGLLQERGFIENTSTKVEKINIPSSTGKQSASGFQKMKPRRNFETERGQTRVSDSPSTPVAIKESRLREIKQPLEAVPSVPVHISQHLLQQFSECGFASCSQKNLLIAFCIMLVLVLIQTSAITLLTRSPKEQYLPAASFSRYRECHEAFARHYGNQDVTLLKQSAHLLGEEISVVEAWLQNMQQSLNLLKANLELAEKVWQNAISSTG